jgi:hypothetical protein
MRIRGRFRRFGRRVCYDITEQKTLLQYGGVTSTRSDGGEESASIDRERVNRSVRSVKRLTDDEARADAGA